MTQQIVSDVRTPNEVAALLKKRREERHLSVKEIALAANIHWATYWRWEQGAEGGCCSVARAALVLGLTPSQLLLKNALEPTGKLPAEIERRLAEIVIEARRLHQYCEGASRSPIEIIAEHLKYWNQCFGLPEARRARPVKKGRKRVK